VLYSSQTHQRQKESACVLTARPQILPKNVLLEHSGKLVQVTGSIIRDLN